MMATGYPLLDIFISTLYLAVVLFWLIMASHILADLFRSHALSGLAKASWILLILLFPLIGCLLYVLVRGGTRSHEEVRPANDDQQFFEDYIRKIANTKE